MAEDEKTPSATSAGAGTPDASMLSEKLVAAPELTSAAEWPWMKIPEAAPSAEASAKSEVLEGQPLTFQRNLWDRFDFLWKNRIEASQGLLQKVCDVLKSRAELERKYGESLLSLGEGIGPEAGNSLHGAVEDMIVNFRNRGEQSLVLADELESDIIVSFECVIKQHKEVSKRIYSDVQLLVKQLQDRKKVHDKCARRYGSRCVEAENASQDCLQAVSMKTQERLKLAQQATMLSKQARVAEYDYYSSIDQANKAQCLYEQQMAHVLEVLQEMEEKRGQCLRDCLRKLAVYETSWLRNMQYDLEGVAKAAEDCDAVRELQNFIETSNKEVSAAPAMTRHVAMPFHQLGKGREARKMTPELQLHLQVQQQIRQLMDEMSPFITSLLEGSETEEEVEKFCQKLSESKLRAAFCQVARLAVLKDDPPGTEIDGSAGKNLSPGAFEALTCCFKVALDAADEHNDAWSGRDLMVLAQLYRTEQDGKAVSLLSKVYNHALWNKVTFWEDVLLLSLCEAYAAEAVWRRSLAPGSQFSKPAMTSFLQRFVGYMMAFGISFEQGRNSVASTLRKHSAFLGPQTVQVYSQLLLSAYEVATPEGTMGTDSLNIAMLEGLPSGGIAMQPAATDLGGDDFEAVAFGVQADFSENPGSPGWFQYFLVTMMTCSTLAAIMSTADSAVMGASSIVSIDVVKGSLLPNLSTKNVVRLGEATSVIICILASIMGMYCNDEQLGTMIVFQGGMNMQLLPAFGLGLYFPIKEIAVTSGIIAGLISLVIVLIVGNPVEDYVPTVYISAAINFLSVALVQGICSARPRHEAVAGEALSIGSVRDAMSTSREPKLVLVALMLGIAVASAPWYGTPGEEEEIIYGLPRWGLFQLAAFVMMFFVGGVACALWKPPMDSKVVKGLETAT